MACLQPLTAAASWYGYGQESGRGGREGGSRGRGRGRGVKSGSWEVSTTPVMVVRTQTCDVAMERHIMVIIDGGEGNLGKARDKDLAKFRHIECLGHEAVLKALIYLILLTQLYILDLCIILRRINQLILLNILNSP